MRARNPIDIRQAIAERFALALPESLYDQIDRMINRKSKERSIGSIGSIESLSSPIEKDHPKPKKRKRFLIKILY